jgi:hypothetical protein
VRPDLALLPALALIAVGSGLSYAPTFVAGTTGVPVRLHGLASGFLNSAQERGADVGITVLGAVAAASTIGSSLFTGYGAGLVLAASVMAASLPAPGEILKGPSHKGIHVLTGKPTASHLAPCGPACLLDWLS